MTRRQFLAGAGASLFPASLERLAAAQRGKVKITDVKCMIVRGTWDWNLIRIETDSGLYGLGEAYWGYGVKDLVVNHLKQVVVGEDPMNVDRLYTKMLMRSAGQGAIAGVTMTAASGIEIALWDLVGRILNTPVCNLLGGRFRDRVRFYRTMQVLARVNDPHSWRDMVRAARAEKFGWTAFKFQGDGVPPAADPQYREPGHDPYGRALTHKDYKRIVDGMTVIREELGWEADFGIEAHWKYDTRDVIRLCRELEPVKPMWIEDPVPPDNPEAMARVTHAVDIPVCTGENLYGRHGFRRLIELQACDVVHIDIPKSGGLLEAKRIADHADMYYIWTAAHNPASPIGTIASAHACSAMRDFRIHELAKYIDWWENLVVHDGPIIKDGYFTIQDKPGLGVEINPDVARAHLAPGETWWG
ncbi:MAG: mandelate racemase/muconate lactonizing enzyme family protein [Acidobacteria bacterium]|nr:mandelate racemase/muconate lactonizing enzyme family protein [Acidobacteriota bacterium]